MTLCGIAGTAIGAGGGAVVFELDVEIPELSWRATRRCRVGAVPRSGGHRWHRLAVALPALPAGPRDPPSGPRPSPTVVVRLTARTPDGDRLGGAQLLWGDPRLETRRAVSDMRLSIRGLASRLQSSGLAGVLRHLHTLEASDSDAAGYRLWAQRHTPGPDELARMAGAAASIAWRPLISVIVPVHNTHPVWLQSCLESVRRQVYPDWELCVADDGSTSSGTLRVIDEYRRDARVRVVRLPTNRGISAASNAALDLAAGEFLALLDHDDELAPEALFEVVRFLNRRPDADLIYTDEDKLAPSGIRCDPHFKPDWSPEHLRSTMYLCHLLVARTSLVRDVGAFRQGYEGAQDYDLVLRLSERTSRIHHLPLVLYHWRKTQGSAASFVTAKPWAHDSGARALQDHVTRSGLDAVVDPGAAPGLYRVRHRIAGSPLVSIVIPTAGQTRRVNGQTVDLLAACLTSIERVSSYEHREIIVVDDGRLPPSALAFLETVPHRRASAPADRPFNFSERIDLGVAFSRGSHLVLLNDDVEVITPNWIEAMLEYSQQEAIGAVGAKLFYPDGRLQHVGVVLGVCGVAAHPYHRSPASTPGHGWSAMIVRNYSAVTAACLMTRRGVFERVGGFDRRFTLDFNDLDYCLRLRRAGLRIVYTPFAQLYHHEWSTAGPRQPSESEARLFREQWRETCENDPHYNPNLSREAADYRVRVT